MIRPPSGGACERSAARRRSKVAVHGVVRERARRRRLERRPVVELLGVVEERREELGLVGALIIVFVFAIFLWRGMRAALRAPDTFGMLLGIGIVVGIVSQALLNISVVLALVPTKGIPLPFISYGGSSIVPTLAGVGILLNISQYGALGKRGNFDEGDYEDEWEEAPHARRKRLPRQRASAQARAR